MTWAFDLDGSLIDLLTGSYLRPGARDLLAVLAESGVGVVLWSAGGGSYASERAIRLGLDHLVTACYDKVRATPGGRWRTDLMDPANRPDVCVDDQPGGCPDGVLVLAVRPFITANGVDDGLASVLRVALSYIDARMDGHPPSCKTLQ